MAGIDEMLESLSADDLRELLASLEEKAKSKGKEEGKIAQATREFKAFLDGEGLKYHEVDGKHLAIPFGGDDDTDIVIHVFVQGEQGLQARTNDLVGFPSYARQRAEHLVSELNNEYRYGKFCLDSDDTAHMEFDLPTCDEHNFKVFRELLILTVRIGRDALPRLKELKG